MLSDKSIINHELSTFQSQLSTMTLTSLGIPSYNKPAEEYRGGRCLYVRSRDLRQAVDATSAEAARGTQPDEDVLLAAELQHV